MSERIVRVLGFWPLFPHLFKHNSRLFSQDGTFPDGFFYNLQYSLLASYSGECRSWYNVELLAKEAIQSSVQTCPASSLLPK